MLRIKICGLTTPQDAQAAIELGADALGFNFFNGSKRYLPVAEAGRWIGQLPGEVEKIAILVDPEFEAAKAVARVPGVDAIQLHGSESPEFCRRLKDEGIRFEKAIPVTSPELLQSAPQFFTRTVLLDSVSAGEFGGSGRSFPWELARDFVQANPDLRVTLAGGLNPHNVARAIQMVRPFGVDVTTGVESSPGHKDLGLLGAFISAARGA
ncbi:MAG TPA: phosphoribosylanthranilate isomerase [Chthoniobacterales bacterium]|jgi:phosphoribosylanthranilate isomerase|nr:phosphoribosylanthranilate isomerase [Chthoniobacterales bacterium]